MRRTSVIYFQNENYLFHIVTGGGGDVLGARPAAELSSVR
jgi:hypothetical protein